MIRIGQCPVCDQPVELKPKARLHTCCSPECRKVLRAQVVARYNKTPKSKARLQRHAKTPKRRASIKKWRDTKGAAWRVGYLKRNPSARIACSLRARIGNVLSGRKKSQPTLAYLGCSREELRAHLEAQFKPGMNWANYGRLGWHVDHRKPLAAFDFVLPDGSLNEAALREALHYSNLQPLWYWENIAKADNLVA